MKRAERYPEEQLERLEAACHHEGIPATVQRRIIFKALIEREDHPTVDQIYAVVRKNLPGVSRTTAYRTLEKLADLGLARRTHHFAASARFDGNMEQHHHFVCTSCGKVVDLENRDVRLEDLTRGRWVDFTVEDYPIYFEGLCADRTKAVAPKNKPAEHPKRAKRTAQQRTDP